MSADFKRMCEENKENRVARVFISSTFLDMKEERDYLGKVVFPRIETFCKKRGVEFVPIDLRWGITENQAQNGKTLEICLKEINHSRPFFICLLGDRYGSPISSLKGELNETFLKDYPNVNGYKTEDIGVTEAEIRHGVLDVTDEVKAYFCFRASSSVVSCDPRLTKLKDEIRNDPRNFSVYEYVKSEDGQGNKSSWLQKLGEKIESAVMVWIDKTWSNGSDLSWLERQNLEQSAFERSRSRLYVSNPGDYDALDAFAEGVGDSLVLAVTGESGLGKSSLLINWANHYREKNSNALVLAHYVSASEGSDQPENILRRLTETLEPSAFVGENNGNYSERLEQGNSFVDMIGYFWNRIKRFLGVKENLKKKEKIQSSRLDRGISLDDLKNVFAIAVNRRLSENPNSPIIIVIDGLNQLSESDDAKILAWLPEHPKTRVIVSTVDSDKETSDAIKRRQWGTYKIQPLTAEQKYKIIKKTLEDRGRSLSPERTQKITESPVVTNPLALCVLLDELCCFTDFKSQLDSKEETQLDLAIANYTDSTSIEELLWKIFERVEESLSWLNKTSDEETVVPLLASLIAVSRHGLTDGELRMISGYNQLVVSTFLSVFDVHLVDRSGRYSYSHNYIRKVIEKRHESKLSDRRQQLVEFFDKMEHPEDVYLDNAEVDIETRKLAHMCAFKRRCQEVPWQLKELGHWERLYEFLLDFDVFDELYDGELTSDFCLYWNELSKLDKEKAENEKKFKFDGYLGLKLDDSGYDDEKKARLWHKMGHITNFYIVPKVSERAFSKALSLYLTLAKQRPEVYNLNVIKTLTDLGELYRQTGSYLQAESKLTDSLSLCRTLVKLNPSEAFPILAATLVKMAILHTDTEAYELAEVEYQESLMIQLQFASLSYDDFASELAMTLMKYGNFHRALIRYGGFLHNTLSSYFKANLEYKLCLAIYRDLASKNPNIYNAYVAMALCSLASLHNHVEEEYVEVGRDFELDIDRVTLYLFHLLYRDQNGERLDSDDITRLKSDLELEFYNQMADRNLDCDKAESEYEESLGLYYDLAKQNPIVYNPFVAKTLNDQGDYYRNRGGEDAKAESKLEESLLLYRELADNNHEVYDSYLATTLNNLGCCHCDMASHMRSYTKEEAGTEWKSLYSQAESELRESLEIRRMLAFNNSEVYNSDVAQTLANLGNLHSEIDSCPESESEYKESLGLYRNLAKKNHKTYNSKVGEVLGHLGMLYTKTGRSDLAKECFDESRVWSCAATEDWPIEEVQNFLEERKEEIKNEKRDSEDIIIGGFGS